MKILYEATIGQYNFVLQDESVIEVWVNTTDEFPFTYIYLKPGSVISEKDFQKEISWWYMDNA